MTANEELLNEAISLGLILDQLAADSFGRVLVRLQSLRDDLAALVVRHDPTDVTLDVYRRNRLEALIEDANREIDDAYRQIEDQVSQDLDDVAVLTQDSLSATLALLLLFRGLSRQLDETGRRAARDDTRIEGATVSEWWEAQALTLRQRTSRALTDALRLKQLGQEAQTADLIDAVRNADAGGLFSPLPRNTLGVIRSAFHAVANRVRFENITRHPELFRAFQHVSVLDGRTTSMCRQRANRLWLLDGTPIRHSFVFKIPPIHFLCRSHLIGVLYAFDDMPPKIQKRIGRDFFRDAAAAEPSLAEWLALRGETQEADPLNYQDARTKLGL